MKKSIYTIILCLLCVQVIAQNYSIEKNNLDDFVADYAEDIIQKNTPSDSRHYAYTLTQNDKEFLISCNVTPDNISVTEQTNDVWNEMEATVIRAINRVKQSLAYGQSQPTLSHTDQSSLQSTNHPQSSATIAPKQPVQQLYPQQQSQANQNRPPQTSAQIVYQQQPAQNSINGNNIPQMDSYISMGYNLQIQNYTLDDVINGRATLGGKIMFDDGTCGVIFFLDGMGHGLAVSLDETEVKWQNAKAEKYCQDIYQLVNESEPSKYCNGGLGSAQTQMIINQLGWGQAPAAEWCLRHGNGWYLPSAGELWYLFTVANYPVTNLDNGKKKPDAQDGFISKMIQAAGGQPLDSRWYWSSSEEEQESAWNVNVLGRFSSEDKTNEVAVRAIRCF